MTSSSFPKCFHTGICKTNLEGWNNNDANNISNNTEDDEEEGQCSMNKRVLYDKGGWLLPVSHGHEFDSLPYLTLRALA